MNMFGSQFNNLLIYQINFPIEITRNTINQFQLLPAPSKKNKKNSYMFFVRKNNTVKENTREKIIYIKK